MEMSWRSAMPAALMPVREVRRHGGETKGDV
jgi:hypothetical protein